MKRSLIAGINAEFRNYESLYPMEQRILQDIYAFLFMEKTLVLKVLHCIRFFLPFLNKSLKQLQVAHCVRHLSIEKLFLESLNSGCKQFVIFGAGYDTRYLRYKDRLKKCKLIEIDHPSTQKRKLELLKKNKIDHDYIEFVSGNFYHDTLESLLKKSSFDPQLKTCFIAEGLVHYLTLQNFTDFLRVIAQFDSDFIFSFISSDMRKKADSTFISLIKALKEIPSQFFSKDEIISLCNKHSLKSIGHWDIQSQIKEFVPVAFTRSFYLSQDIFKVSTCFNHEGSSS